MIQRRFRHVKCEVEVSALGSELPFAAPPTDDCFADIADGQRIGPSEHAFLDACHALRMPKDALSIQADTDQFQTGGLSCRALFGSPSRLW